jgi:hypothetical protein
MMAIPVTPVTSVTLLRAGRGAAERGEILDARRWLMEAEAQAIQGGVRGVAAEARRTAAALARP